MSASWPWFGKYSNSLEAMKEMLVPPMPSHYPYTTQMASQLTSTLSARVFMPKTPMTTSQNQNLSTVINTPQIIHRRPMFIHYPNPKRFNSELMTPCLLRVVAVVKVEGVREAAVGEISSVRKRPRSDLLSSEKFTKSNFCQIFRFYKPCLFDFRTYLNVFKIISRTAFFRMKRTNIS